MNRQNVLNHRIDAPRARIRVDGDNTDWDDATDALFVGSDSQAQAAVRPAKDDDNLYFLVERLDADLSDGDTVELYPRRQRFRYAGYQYPAPDRRAERPDGRRPL